jgi:hypothetical protein
MASSRRDSDTLVQSLLRAMPIALAAYPLWGAVGA